ncbi:unnamed protein product [Ceutorhynchus assimilis]|uniref:Chitin-binding type-4 domain-containing protein n=1 Tax=Ceutorhynchus assimilis TaxID=467358 RepID=A0A9N9QKM8_9CUCU|nr:unnamed protein product [Ceutorhynchus assimilis]
MKVSLVVLFFFAVYFSVEVTGHGYMIVPANRASLWRIDWQQPINYEDNEYFCGGAYAQYYKNHGKCGPCGDDWRDPVPRSNENGGIYGNGIIVANYTAGSVIDVTVLITANHLGALYFHICDLKDGSQAETEECFHPMKLADGTNSYPVHALDYRVDIQLRLPKDLVCERCVLRWHYRTGNSWGICEDGTQNMGCGNQEIFRSCADISIAPPHPGHEFPSGVNSKEATPEEPFKEFSSSEETMSHLDSHERSDSGKPRIINPYFYSNPAKN